jgi:hypothetical protein
MKFFLKKITFHKTNKDLGFSFNLLKKNKRILVLLKIKNIFSLSTFNYFLPFFFVFI